MLVATEKDYCPFCLGNGFVSGFSFDEGSYADRCMNCDGTGHLVANRTIKDKSKIAMQELLKDCHDEI